MKNQGLPSDVFDGRPVIGIANTFSELTPCNAHFRELAERVKRGVWEAGGFPVEFPVISLGEQYMKPTTMLFRNLMAMDVEESIRANPVDAVVLLCGCDKTTPAMLMGAASADVPAIVVTGGPTLSGNYKNTPFGTGTDGRKIFDLHRIGQIGAEELQEIEGCMVRSAGHCTVMGTASTMASMAEALGMTLPGNAAIPAVDSRRAALADLFGVLWSPHVSMGTVVYMAASIHLAVSTPNFVIMEGGGAHLGPLGNRLLVDPLEYKPGAARVPERPGLGVEFNEAELKKIIATS